MKMILRQWDQVKESVLILTWDKILLEVKQRLFSFSNKRITLKRGKSEVLPCNRSTLAGKTHVQKQVLLEGQIATTFYT